MIDNEELYSEELEAKFEELFEIMDRAFENKKNQEGM